MDAKSIEKPRGRFCPFTQISVEAAGEWFVGRKQLLRNIVQYVVQPDGRLNNCSVVGLPRIGKSSLLKALLNNEDLLSRYDRLIVTYVSINNCDSANDMWKLIGESLKKEIKEKLGPREDFCSFRGELNYAEIDLEAKRSDIDYDYVRELAKCMQKCGYLGLVLIDEFDNFPKIATNSVVGNFRTVFSGEEYGIRAILASRRTVERIEKEVKAAISKDVSTLASVFDWEERINPFDENEMEEYWNAVSSRVGNEVSQKYRSQIVHYAGTHPMLLNLLNYSYWLRTTSDDYLWDTSEPQVEQQDLERLHHAFEKNVWEEIKKWELINTLILHTWGPSIDVNKEDLRELERYGIIDGKVASIPNGPLAIAVSQHFTGWMALKRYELPFTDIWSITEKSLRTIVKRYCDDKYGGDVKKMREKIEDNDKKNEKNANKYGAQSAFKGMQLRMEKALDTYTTMSDNLLDYSNPIDLPKIFFKRDWPWFGQIFGSNWEDWEEKFEKIRTIRNFRGHNNEGVPEGEIRIAKKYCADVNTLIDKFTKKRDNTD